jgi:hypothetical protein
MLFFEFKDKMRKFPILTKLWMYPVAYALYGAAKAAVWAVDKFNITTLRKMCEN